MERIEDTLRRVFALARERGIDTAAAADRVAEDRIEAVSRVGRIWSPGAPGAARPMQPA